MTTAEIITLSLVASVGHIMALIWYWADRRAARLCSKRIYDLPLGHAQTRRELRNSMHAPLHGVLLALVLACGQLQERSIASFFLSLLVTSVWAEVWHYASHRLLHVRALHWIHREHHKSRLNSPFTAISFSFLEKLIFDAGIIGLMLAFDAMWGVNLFGVAGWYIGYLVINSFSHANFEMKSVRYLRCFGKLLTSSTYHSLHHARYVGNYGLGTRFLDRLLGTEWSDYEGVYSRVTGDRIPLRGLAEKVPPRTVRPNVTAGDAVTAHTPGARSSAGWHCAAINR